MASAGATSPWRNIIAGRASGICSSAPSLWSEQFGCVAFVCCAGDALTFLLSPRRAPQRENEAAEADRKPTTSETAEGCVIFLHGVAFLSWKSTPRA
jgi:hypothetical protein